MVLSVSPIHWFGFSDSSRSRLSPKCGTHGQTSRTDVSVGRGSEPTGRPTGVPDREEDDDPRDPSTWVRVGGADVVPEVALIKTHGHQLCPSVRPGLPSRNSQCGSSTRDSQYGSSTLTCDSRRDPSGGPSPRMSDLRLPIPCLIL